MKRLNTAIFVTALFAASLCARTVVAKTRAVLDINPRVLRMGQQAQCTLTVEGGDNLTPPRLPGTNAYDIRYRGVIQNYSFSMGPGKNKSHGTVVFSYTLTPLKTGKFNVGPYTYKIGKENIQLPAIELTVTESNAGEDSNSLSKLLFAKMVLPSEKLYSQQIFNIVLNIYIDERLNLAGNFEPYGFPENGVKMNNFDQSGTRRKVIDGHIYNIMQFEASAQALASGEYKFNPGLRVGLRVPRQQRQSHGLLGDSFFDSFFERAQVQTVDVTMEPIAFTIAPLPATNRPTSFSGAVGKFSFDITATPCEVETGNPVTLTMTVAGKGNISNVSAPALELGNDFKSYEARLVSTDENTARVKKVFEQVIIPKSEEIKAVPAIEFSYFDTTSETYKTIKRGPFPLTVKASTSKLVQISAPDKNGNAKLQPEILGDDIVYLKSAPDKATATSIFSKTKTVHFWAIQTSPLLGIAILAFWRKRQKSLESNVALARRQKAPRAARAALNRAEEALKKNDDQAFFEALRNAGSDYFGHRLNLGAGEIESRQALEFCRRGNLPADMIDELHAIFNRCEQERFAGGGVSNESDDDKPAMLNNMRSILKHCEKIKNQSGAASLRTIAMLSAICMGGLAIGGQAAPANNDSMQRGFIRAAEHYDAGELDAAMKEYHTLMDNGQSSEALLYNIGNTYFRQHKFGKAILFYRRAWWMSPRDPDIKANMLLAIRNSGAVMPKMSLPLRVFTMRSRDEWLKLTILFYWCSAFLFGGYIVIRKHRQWLLNSALICFAVMIIGGTGLYCWIHLGNMNEAVVVQSGQEARSAPIPDSTARFVLPEGSIVRVLNNSGSWLHVESGGQKGWINKSVCAKVFLLH